MLAGSSLFAAQASPPHTPARLAIYYGYPSAVNRSAGDVSRAASVFSQYDAVVLGDGIEFLDQRPGRRPEGVGAEEHQKAADIIAAVARRSPATQFFGYICLGDSQSLSEPELKARVLLWKQMGVSGIFLDEAGYDWKIVTRERQNAAVDAIHKAGLIAFPNAYYPEDLFSPEDLRGKNHRHLPSLLGRRDVFLLESFQVKSGAYADVAEWQQRLSQALDGRRRCGSRIFATTTTTETANFEWGKFSYAWWSAWLYDLDGFSWGEPNFAATNNMLPDRRCTLPSAILNLSKKPSSQRSDQVRFSRSGGDLMVTVDTSDHSVHFGPRRAEDLATRVSDPGTLLSCGDPQ